MKIIFVSLAITALSLSVHAGKTNFKYLITDTDTIICKKMRIGFFNTHCQLHSGEERVVSNKNIKLISYNFHVKEKKPVYIDNFKTGKTQMMDLVGYKKGIKIYQCEIYDISKNQMNLLISFFKDDECINSFFYDNINEVNAFIYQYSDRDDLLTKK